MQTTAYEIGQCLEFRGLLFQAEDGIRDWSVTGVQTCALPIYENVDASRSEDGCDVAEQERSRLLHPLQRRIHVADRQPADDEVRLLARAELGHRQIGRASCRERGESAVGAGAIRRKKQVEERE